MEDADAVGAEVWDEEVWMQRVNGYLVWVRGRLAVLMRSGMRLFEGEILVRGEGGRRGIEFPDRKCGGIIRNCE